jgi:hypothetical protein
MNDLIKKRLTAKIFFKKIIALSNIRYSHYALCVQLCLLSVKSAREDLKIKYLEKFIKDYPSFDRNSLEAKKILSVINFLERSSKKMRYIGNTQDLTKLSDFVKFTG